MSISIEKTKQLIENNFDYYRGLPQYLQNNYEIALFTVQQYGGMLFYLPDKFKDDKNIVTIAVSKTDFAFKWSLDNIKNNKKMAIFAMKQCIYNFEYISNSLKRDYDLIKMLINKYFWGFKYLDRDFIKDDLNIQIFLMKRVHPRQINRVCDNLDNITNLRTIKHYIDTPKMYFDLPLYKKQHMWSRWSRFMNVRPTLLCFERCFNIYDIELPPELIYMILGFLRLEDLISI